MLESLVCTPYSHKSSIFCWRWHFLYVMREVRLSQKVPSGIFIWLNQSIYSIKLHFTSSPRSSCSLHNKLSLCGTRWFWLQLQSILENGWHFSVFVSRVDIQLKFIGWCIHSIYNYFFVFSSILNAGIWHQCSKLHILFIAATHIRWRIGCGYSLDRSPRNIAVAGNWEHSSAYCMYKHSTRPRQERDHSQSYRKTELILRNQTLMNVFCRSF